MLDAMKQLVLFLTIAVIVIFCMGVYFVSKDVPGAIYGESPLIRGAVVLPVLP